MDQDSDLDPQLEKIMLDPDPQCGSETKFKLLNGYLVSILLMRKKSEYVKNSKRKILMMFYEILFKIL